MNAHENEINEMLTKIDEEKLSRLSEVSDELAEAAKNYAQQDKWMYEHFGDVIMKAVFFGATWQKEKMLENAVDGWLDEDNTSPYDLNIVSRAKIPFGEFRHGENVRLIIVKEEKK